MVLRITLRRELSLYVHHMHSLSETLPDVLSLVVVAWILPLSEAPIGELFNMRK